MFFLKYIRWSQQNALSFNVPKNSALQRTDEEKRDGEKHNIVKHLESRFYELSELPFM